MIATDELTEYLEEYLEELTYIISPKMIKGYSKSKLYED